MTTRQIDEIHIYSMLLQCKRVYETRNPQTHIPLWRGLKLVPIFVYGKLNSHAQSVLNRVKSNIACGLYSARDLRNYMILMFATGCEVSANTLPTGHEEICAVANAMSDKRFTADKLAFKKIHERFIREGVIPANSKIPDVYFKAPDGTPSMMYRLTLAGSVSPRFYLSGLNAVTTVQPNRQLGVLESTYRKMVTALSY